MVIFQTLPLAQLIGTWFNAKNWFFKLQFWNVYVKNTKSEFAAFQRVTLSHVCRLLQYLGFLAIKPLEFTRFLVKLLK
jgi:hypothetical protein